MDYRTGLPGPGPGAPKPEPLREVAVINFASCQLFLDFGFVNIRGGLNISYLWLEAVYFVTRPGPGAHGFIIRPCVRVHNNNTLQHEITPSNIHLLT